MSKDKRQQRIIALLRSSGKIELSDLSSVMPDVSRVTLRRDMAELAASGVITRTHGGATLTKPDTSRTDTTSQQKATGFVPRVVSVLDDIDAIILPPIYGRGSNALRRQIRRSGIPYLAESAPQQSGVYLGPVNFQAAYELGVLAAKQHKVKQKLQVLLISHAELSNRQVRSEGFEKGLRETFSGHLTFTEINGQGSYRSAYQVASDVLNTDSDINIIFGVNDHSALAGLDAARQYENAVNVYAVGGERAEFLARMTESQSSGIQHLKAVAALFPTVVGAIAIDALALKLFGQDLPEQLLTPFRIITPQNLKDFYQQDRNENWSLRDSVFDSLVSAPKSLPRRKQSGVKHVKKRIGFLPHFPAHDWYRAMIQSMQQRAELYGMALDLIPPDQGIFDELNRLQREIAIKAVSRVASNETVIIGEGPVTLQLARELRRKTECDGNTLSGITVITNSFDVLFELDGASQIKTVLTGGEYRADPRCLVGSSLGALFDRVRADKAFISAAGLSTKFGVSAVDERRALAASCFIAAAKRTVVLADHTFIGVDANHRISHLNEIDEVITDDAVLPVDRQKLRTAGVDLCIVDNNNAGVSEKEVPRARKRVRKT